MGKPVLSLSKQGISCDRSCKYFSRDSSPPEAERLTFGMTHNHQSSIDKALGGILPSGNFCLVALQISQRRKTGYQHHEGRNQCNHVLVRVKPVGDQEVGIESDEAENHEAHDAKDTAEYIHPLAKCFDRNFLQATGRCHVVL